MARATVRGAPRPPGRGLLVALIHAHDEQDRIGKAIRSLDGQSSPPTSRSSAPTTALTALPRGTGTRRRRLRERRERAWKAGALNQVLDLLLPCSATMTPSSSLDVHRPSARTSGRGPPAPDERRRRVGSVHEGVDEAFAGLIKNTKYARSPASSIARRRGAGPSRETRPSSRSLRSGTSSRPDRPTSSPEAGRASTTCTRWRSDGELTLALLHLGYEIVPAPELI